MRGTKNRMRRLMPVLLALVLGAPGLAAAAPPRKSVDVCVALPGYFEFVYQDVQPLEPGRTIPLRGIFIGPQDQFAPFAGTAAMTSDGVVRVGVLVHGGLLAGDFTMRGWTDTSFEGSFSLEYDGDPDPDGSLTLATVDCSTIPLP